MPDNTDDTQINNIHTLTFKPENFQWEYFMRVIETENGEARIIYNEENNTYMQVHLRTCGCAFLSKDDLVYIAATEYGIVIINKMRSTGNTRSATFNDPNVINIQTTAYKPETFKVISYIMTVKECDNGMARIVVDTKNNTRFTIQEHNSIVPYLVEHDKVLVTNTTKGYCVVDKLPVNNERTFTDYTRLENGDIQLDKQLDITINCGNNIIHVTKEGDISINGVQVEVGPNDVIVYSKKELE